MHFSVDILFWRVFCQRWRVRGILSALTVNHWIDFDQPCTDKYVGQSNEMIRFYDLGLVFKVSRVITVESFRHQR